MTDDEKGIDDIHRTVEDIFHRRTKRNEKEYERYQHAANILASAALRAQRMSDLKEVDEAVDEDIFDLLRENLEDYDKKSDSQ